MLVLRRVVEAAAAEVHRGLEASAEGDLHREGARPDDEAGGEEGKMRERLRDIVKRHVTILTRRGGTSDAP